MMTESDHKVWNAVFSVLKGNSSAEERKLFEEWLNDSEENIQIYAHLSRIGFNGSLENAVRAKEKIFNSVQKRIITTQAKHSIKIWQYISAASIAIIMIIGSYCFFDSDSADSIANIEAKSPYGIRSMITLPDGTIVNLNSGSTLIYPANFVQDERKVIIKGEAYFEVSEDKKHPFIVTANEISIKVLGTHFNIKAYAEDNQIVTSLIQGSICITRSGNDIKDRKGIVLSPNQQAIFYRTNDSLKVQNVNANLYTTWKEGQYYFEGESFIEIARKLERGFNIKIVIQSEKLKKEIFSGIFDNDESIYQILNIMKEHQNFNYTQRENKIFIYEK